MATSVKTIDQYTRITSSKGKLYLALKDGKRHQISSLKALKLPHLYTSLYALGRLLRAHFGKTIVITDRFEKTGTFQMVPYNKPSAKKASAKSAKKVVAKKASKPVAKKAAPVAETVTA